MGFIFELDFKKLWFSGELLGIMQSKVGIIYLLKNHFYTLVDETQDEIMYEPRAILLASNKGLNLNVYRDDCI